MISFKKYLDADLESVQTLLRVCHILLQGMSEHALEYDSEYRGRFRRSIQAIADSFTEALPAHEFLVQAGAAVKSFEEYNGNAAAHLLERKNELNSMVSILASALTAVSFASCESVTRLQDIETKLVVANRSSDVHALRARLQDCVDSIRSEVVRQRTDAEKTKSSLAAEVERLNRRTGTGGGSPSIDALTGLQNREACESALAIRCAGEKQVYVGVLSLDRLQLYNSRYGRKIGDEILKFFTTTLGASCPPRYTLYRWGGPTLLAIIDQPSMAIEDVRLQLKSILEKIPEHTVETETRTVMLSMASRWVVFQTIPAVQLLLRKIELFTSVHNNAAADK